MSMVTNAEMAICYGAFASHALENESPYAFVEVASKFEDVRAEWRELYAQAMASPYQSFEFVSNWFDTLGRDQKLEPLIVIARDEDQRPLALLPLALAKRGPLRMALFLGGRDSNFNLGLFRRGVEFNESAIVGLLSEAAHAAPRRPDLFYLLNQPHRFDGDANPMVLPISRPSPSAAYGTKLPAEDKALDARITKDTRKKLRKKEARLAELGDLRYEHEASGPLAKKIVQTLIAQKSKQFASFENVAFRAFLDRMSSADAESALELHALTLRGKIVAAYAGLSHRGRFSAVLNSYDTEEHIARCSPGELLLHALLRNLVSREFTHFDLGIGEARYKNSVCDGKIDLYDTILPTTLKGALAAPAFAGLLGIKKRIKHTLWMTRAVITAGRLRNGLIKGK
jgi:CelD/BcsL family acetyltransferase involved in cellulose biosynthesis